MPWKECNKMDEPVRFVARLLAGEKMAPLCRSFGISRKTGYKIFQRYKDMGLEGLTDRSRRPYRHANRLPFQVEQLIVSLKKEQPSWGAPKGTTGTVFTSFRFGSGGPRLRLAPGRIWKEVKTVPVIRVAHLTWSQDARSHATRGGDWPISAARCRGAVLPER